MHNIYIYILLNRIFLLSLYFGVFNMYTSDILLYSNSISTFRRKPFGGNVKNFCFLLFECTLLAVDETIVLFRRNNVRADKYFMGMIMHGYSLDSASVMNE